MVEVDLLNPRAGGACFVPIPAPWLVVEVPHGCLAEFPAVLTYSRSYLLADAQNGAWVAFYTEWTARVAAYLLWDVFDTYHLLYITLVWRQKIRSLDLSCPFGLQCESSRGTATVISHRWCTVGAGVC